MDTKRSLYTFCLAILLACEASVSVHAQEPPAAGKDAVATANTAKANASASSNGGQNPAQPNAGTATQPAPAAVPKAPVMTPKPNAASIAADASLAQMGVVDEQTQRAYQNYKRASERYKREIETYRIDLRRSLMTEYQNRLSSVDAAYDKKIASLRSEEAEMRVQVIERMEAFLKRYGDKEPSVADILYRLARLYYEQADDAFLASDGAMEYPDFSKSLAYIERLFQNFPQYEQMDGALYLKGYCLAQMDREEEARDTYMVLLEKYPDSKRKAEVLTRIGEYYFGKSQDAILGLGGEILWKQAMEYYAKAVAEGPNTSVYDRALYRKAWTEYYTEDYAGMIHDFISLVGYADNVENGSALRAEAIDFMAAALAEEDWDLSDNVDIDPDYGMKRFRKYLHSGAKFEAEVLRRFADTLMEQTRYEHAAEAYEAYIAQDVCAEDLPQVIRVYVAALRYSGQHDKAAKEQGRIDSLIGIDSPWYKCQEKEGNYEAIANANIALQIALKNSIIAFHDKVTKAEEAIRAAQEILDSPDLSKAARTAGQKKLDAAKANLIQMNKDLAQITATFVKRYPNDEEGYNYRYLMGQAYFYSNQYEKAAEAFMTIRDIDNARYQADAARYIADAYEIVIQQKAKKDRNYLYALPLQDLVKLAEDGKLDRKLIPTSLLVAHAVPSMTKEEIEEELKARRGGSKKIPIPEDVLKLVEAREAFGATETKLGKGNDADSLAPQYRYDNAMIFYNYGDFEEAEKRFNLIIQDAPSSEHAASAADIIIAEYESQGNVDKVAELSDLYVSMHLGSAEPDDIVSTRYKDKKYNALFQKAFKLFDDKKYLEAAAEFMRIIEENPTFEHNDRAIYNAAYAYEQMKHYDSAMQLYRRVLNEYADTEEAVSALYRIGVNAEMFFDFDTAIDSFMTIYNSKKPLYRDFKYRMNTLRNAAHIKLLIEDRKGAAELLERYYKDFPAQSDAPQFLYEAGRAYAELGNISEAQRIFREFRKNFSSDPSMRPYVIASYTVEGKLLRSRKKIKDAREAFETARALYQNAPAAAGPIGRDNAAEASFALAELDYEDWKAVKFHGKMQAMLLQLKEHMAQMKKIYGEFAQVMTYNSQIWGIASRYAIARMMHELVVELENIPKPSDVKTGSDNHLAFLASMSDMATGTRDEAIKMYKNAIEASKIAGISMEWTQKSLDGIQQLDRTASHQERIAPMVYMYSPGGLVSPEKLRRAEQERAEAEARAKAEAEARAKAEADAEARKKAAAEAAKHGIPASAMRQGAAKNTTTRPAPNATRPAPNATRPAPNATRPAPNATRTAPNATRTAPNATRTAPNATRTAPNPGTVNLSVNAQAAAKKKAEEEEKKKKAAAAAKARQEKETDDLIKAALTGGK